MANSRYTPLAQDNAQAHDEKLLAAQNALLEKVATTTVAAAARNYAEAYACSGGSSRRHPTLRLKMAEREIRDSEHSCPQCGSTLRQVWVYGDDGSLAHNKEWQPAGRATCPQGHRLEWTLAGPA